MSVVFFVVGASFVNLGVALDSIPFFVVEFLKLVCGTRLLISYQYVSVDVSILFGVVRGCCHRLFVAVTVDCGFIFVGDGQGISQTDSSLQCQRTVRAQVEFFFAVGALFVGFVWFSWEVHTFHCVFLLVLCFLLCLTVCHSVAKLVVMLYEFPWR